MVTFLGMVFISFMWGKFLRGGGEERILYTTRTNINSTHIFNIFQNILTFFIVFFDFWRGL